VVTEQGLSASGVHLVVRPSDGGNPLDWLPAVANELQRRDIDVSAELPPEWPRSLAWLATPAPGGRTPVMVRTLSGPAEAPPKGWRAVVTNDPFTVAQWAQLHRLRAVMTDPAATDEERFMAALAASDVTTGRHAWQVLVPDIEDIE
jgi:hypothetical protein